jgi:hypothetical protein
VFGNIYGVDFGGAKIAGRNNCMRIATRAATLIQLKARKALANRNTSVQIIVPIR